MMHPPVSDHPLFSEKKLTFWKISKISPSHFHPPKFLTFFFLATNFGFPPIFPALVHFPPDSRKFIISPLLFKISPLFSKKFNSVVHALHVFRFPPTCILTMMHVCITQCTH